jgi:beta-glucanase (GH16 family)
MKAALGTTCRAICIFTLLIIFAPSLIPAEPVLIWSDEFEVDGLPDPEKWLYAVGGHGWGNSESQYYTRARHENARVENGKLIIEARKENWIADEGFIRSSDYTSARLVSKGHGDWLHGRMEVRAKLPAGRGTWPAIWMLPTSNAEIGWPYSGEIDIMEHVGFDMGVIHGSIHNAQRHGANPITNTISIENVDTEFHIYSVDWTPSAFRFFVDGFEYHSYTDPGTGLPAWPFILPFHLIMNVAVGGAWGGAHGIDPDIWPQRMEVDYVRVYDLGDTSTLDTDNDLIPNHLDPDDDDDGLSDVEEHEWGTYIHLADSDGDGFNDFEETQAGSSPISDNWTPDNAGELLINGDFSKGYNEWHLTGFQTVGSQVTRYDSFLGEISLEDYVTLQGTTGIEFDGYNSETVTNSVLMLYQVFPLSWFSPSGIRAGDVITFRGMASSVVSDPSVVTEAFIQIANSEKVTVPEHSQYRTIGEGMTEFEFQSTVKSGETIGDVDTLLIGFKIDTNQYETGSITFTNLEATINETLFWGPWEAVSGIVDTGSWMGLLHVEHDPWIWSEALPGWIFLSEDSLSEQGAWIYIPR